MRSLSTRRRLCTRRGLVISGALALLAASAAAAAFAAGGPISKIAPVSKTTLVVWGPGEPRGQSAALRELDKEFMKQHPGVKIEHTGFDWSTFFGPKLRTAMAAHKGPDVVSMYGGGFAQSSGYTNALRPLYDLLSPVQKKQLNQFGSENVDPGDYALAWGSYAYVWYYNKKLFKQVGLNPAAPPKTLAQLESACSKLKTAGIQPIAAGFKDGYLGGWFHYFGFASELFSPTQARAFAQHKLTWRDPKMLKSLSLIQSLAKQGCFGDESYAKTLDDAHSDFLGGKAAMIYYTNIKGDDLEKALGKGNVGVFPMPRVPGSAYPPGSVNAGANGGWAITNFEPDHCSEAWAYISFVMSPHAQEVAWQKDGQLPNNFAARPKVTNPLDKTVVRLILSPKNQPGVASVSAQESAVEVKLWVPLVRGDRTPQQFADQMQAAREKAPPGKVYAKPKPEPCN